jgi:hypothetical protein
MFVLLIAAGVALVFVLGFLTGNGLQTTDQRRRAERLARMQRFITAHPQARRRALLERLERGDVDDSEKVA